MRRWLPELALVLSTFIWGATFLVTQIALKDAGPFSLLAIRFAVAAIVLACISGRRLAGMTRQELRAGVLIGGVVFGVYALQTVGLLYTTSSKSGFITAMYVPLVPVAQLLVMQRRPSAWAWVGTLFAFAGLILLSIKPGMDLTLGVGEWLTLGAAVAIAAQVVLIGKHAPDADPIRFSVVQLGVVAILSLTTIPIAHESAPHLTPSFLLSIGCLALLGSAVTNVAMNWAQKTVAPTRATLLYALEPVWAGVVGVAAGESLPTAAIFGCALILTGMIVGELPSRERAQVST